ncbi:hypothetical protein GJ496_011321 [Pomphorhynchus laevis]|nr:hypothetical protein GJ496_011321 [Pomphorhynchus laevis]
MSNLLECSDSFLQNIENHTLLRNISTSNIYLHFRSDKKRRIDALKRTHARIKHVLITISTFTFSRIGLCLIVVAYAIAGGFMFKAIEAKNEKKDLQMVIKQKQILLNYLTTYSKNNTRLAYEEWMENVRMELKKFQSEIVVAVRQRGYVGQRYPSGNGQNSTDEFNTNEQWNIAGSVLYAITVITAIGYGNITCKTVLGRTMTMLYALIGIPLMIVFLAIIGSSFADAFRFIYSRVCCFYCRFIEKRTLIIEQQQDPFPWQHQQNNNSHHHQNYTEANVPIVVTLTLLIIYVLIGAYLFSHWEGWSFIDGAYFCFITLSTIGLGDMVPGRSISTSRSPDDNKMISKHIKSVIKLELILCSLYLTIGLSLIIMCFNLVEEGVRAKCRRIGIYLGIVDITPHFSPITSTSVLQPRSNDRVI